MLIRCLNHPSGKMGATYAFHLQLVRKRVVHFLFALIEHSSLQLLRFRCYKQISYKKLNISLTLRYKGLVVYHTQETHLETIYEHVETMTQQGIIEPPCTEKGRHIQMLYRLQAVEQRYCERCLPLNKNRRVWMPCYRLNGSRRSIYFRHITRWQLKRKIVTIQLLLPPRDVQIPYHAFRIVQCRSYFPEVNGHRFDWP